MTRNCDGCTACCEVYDIEALGKTKNVLCEHCAANGCSIYPDRPEVCKAYMCLWLAGDNVPDFMYPKQSGIVIKIDREPKNNGIAIDFHLTGAGLRNWKRGQYYQHMMKLYAATRRMAKTTIVVMRIHSPTGWGMVYDEVRNEFYKIGEPGSDREAYMLGYDIGMPILWGKKDKLKEFRQHIASASEELSQLPEYEQQQIRAELSARKVPMREQILHTNISKLT